MELRSSVSVAEAVPVAGSCSSDLTPSLGNFICRGCAPKKKQQRGRGGGGGGRRREREKKGGRERWREKEEEEE